MSSSVCSIETRFRGMLIRRIETIQALLDSLDRLCTDEETCRQVWVELHTLKGEARLLGLKALAQLVHAIEDEVGVANEARFALLVSATEQMRTALTSSTSDQRREELIAEASAVLARRTKPVSGRGLSLPDGAFDSALGPRTDPPHGGSEKQARGSHLVRLSPMLRELARLAQRMGKERGKDLLVTTHAEGIQLERKVVEQLWDLLIHLVQNAVDHGLEPAAERGSKAVRGKLMISASSQGTAVSIQVVDDGRGIDVEAIRRAAVVRGIIGAPEAQRTPRSSLMQLIFEHGFSTRGEVGATAGRGVGLDVVRRRVDSLGGSVSVETALGEGTKFDILFPAAERLP